MFSGSIDSPRHSVTMPLLPALPQHASPQLAKPGEAAHLPTHEGPPARPSGLETIVKNRSPSHQDPHPSRLTSAQRRQAFAQTRGRSSRQASFASLPLQASQGSSPSSLVSLYASSGSDGGSDSDSEQSTVGLGLPTDLIGARSPAQIKNQAPLQRAAGSGSARGAELIIWGFSTVARVAGHACASQLSDWPYVGAIAMPMVFAMSYLDQDNAKNDKQLGAANYSEALQQIDALEAPLKRAIAVLASEGTTNEEHEVALATTVVAMELLRLLHGIVDTYETAYLPPHEKNLRKACRALQTERLQRQSERAQLPPDALERRQALDEQIASLGVRIDGLKPSAGQDLRALLGERLARFDELRHDILRLEVGIEGTPQDAAQLLRMRAQLDGLKADIDVLQGFIDGTRLKLLNFTDGLGNAELKLFRDSKLFWPRAWLDVLGTALSAAAGATELFSVIAAASGLGLGVAVFNTFLGGLDRAEGTRERETALASATALEAKLLKAAGFLHAHHPLPPDQQQILTIVVRNAMDCRMADLRWSKKHTKAHAMRRFLKGLAVQLVGSPKQIAFIIAGLSLLASNPATGVPLLLTAGALSALLGGSFLAAAGVEQLAKKQRKDRHKRRLDVNQRFVDLHGRSGITRFYTASADERERMAEQLRLTVPKKLRKHCSAKALLSNYVLSNTWLVEQLHQEGMNPPAKKGAPPSLAAQICSGTGLAAGTLGYLKQVAKEKAPEAAREEMQAVLADELFGFKRYDPSRFLDTKAELPIGRTQDRLNSLLRDSHEQAKYPLLTELLLAPLHPWERQHRLQNDPQARADLLALRQELMGPGQPPVDQRDLDKLDTATSAKELMVSLVIGPAVVLPETMAWLVKALSQPALFEDKLLVQADQPLAKVTAPRVPPTNLMKAVKAAGRADQQKHNPLARLAHVIGIPIPNPLGNSSRAARSLAGLSDAKKAKLIEAVLLEYKKLLPVDNVTGEPLVPKGKSEREHLQELLLESAEQARLLAGQTQAGSQDGDRRVGKLAFRESFTQRQKDLALLAGECIDHLKNQGAIPALPPAQHGPFAGQAPLVFAH